MYSFHFCNSQNKKPINIKSDSTVFSLKSIYFLKNIYAGNDNATCKNTQVDSFFGNRILYLLLKCDLNNVSKDTIITSTGVEVNYFTCINTLQLKADTVFLYRATCYERYKTILDSIYPNEKRLYYIPFMGFPTLEYGDVLYAEVSFDAYKLSPRKKTKITYYDGGEYNDTVIYRHPFLLYLNLKNNTVNIVDSTYEQVLQQLKSRKYIEIK